jgi:hypothetical protein
MNRVAMLAAFKADVYDRGPAVDPGNELDWLSLAIGYALGKGYSPARAVSFAQWARYVKQLA